MFNTHGSQAVSAVSGVIRKFFQAERPAPAPEQWADQLDPGSLAPPSTADAEEAVVWLVASLRKTGRLDAALVMIEHACKSRPDRPENHNSRGLVLKACRRYAEALEAFDKALVLRPAYPEAEINRQQIAALLAQG